MAARALSAASPLKLFTFSSSSSSQSSSISLKFPPNFLSAITPASHFSTFCSDKKKKKKRETEKSQKKTTTVTAKAKSAAALEVVKRRTRSEKEFDEEYVKNFGDKDSHIPVLLGEVLDVFSHPFRLRSFVDCTLGAAGHSSAIIQAHPEMQSYIGLDVDPIAHDKAQSRINSVLNSSTGSNVGLKAHMVLKNFKEIKQVIGQVEEKLLISGVDGILMDLGMSSMQVDDAGRGFSMLNDGPLDMRMNPAASLKAEDILNSWPATEVGRVLRDYGEESNWYFLQNKIVKAREGGGLHSTGDLVDLIRSMTYRTKGGRQGWIKTAARVFQALRIAVNDELKTLENSLHSCFDCLGPGGRLAVISFHSLEDRIVKQTFLNIINNSLSKEGDDKTEQTEVSDSDDDNNNLVGKKDGWIKQVVKGSAGIILTKRPITASLEEERLNPRCRSAKLRVIQKIR